jgi:hypothetical protein
MPVYPGARRIVADSEVSFSPTSPSGKSGRPLDPAHLVVRMHTKNLNQEGPLVSCPAL